jgi:UDP-N-acetylglucosamine 2-epimerase (non-hydrolysing)
MKTVVTITGIRPDFIRMAHTFQKLDKTFHHILIHTGQHYDNKLSSVFFSELGIRKPDYILNTGKESTTHYEQLSYLSREIPALFKREGINPHIVLFLGDSNSVGVAFPLKKEGYRIGHIEAGMRSYDRRMLEELNRTVCDHCSDILFVYHDDYKKQLELENIRENVHVVGNTIVEPLLEIREDILKLPKKNIHILLDIHRPENFNSRERLEGIIEFANLCITKYSIPVKLLYFKRLHDSIFNYGLSLEQLEMVPLMSYREYIQNVYDSLFIISDSGTGQEEPALLNTPVIVPRDFTERPQSYENHCSIRLDVDGKKYQSVFDWIASRESPNIEWLGDGNTSSRIVNALETYLNSQN